jgi:hypothetical protein
MTMLIYFLYTVVPYEDLATYLKKFSDGSSQMYEYINNFAAYDLVSAEALRSSLLSSSASSGAGYGIMNTGCLNHGISTSNLFNKSISSSCLSINKVFSLYLSKLSRSRASKSAWVMTWTDRCHGVDRAIQCVTGDCVIDYSSGNNGEHKSLWLVYIIIIVSVGSILLVLAIWYLICCRSSTKKPAVVEVDTHDEQFHLL